MCIMYGMAGMACTFLGCCIDASNVKHGFDSTTALISKVSVFMTPTSLEIERCNMGDIDHTKFEETATSFDASNGGNITTCCRHHRLKV